MQVHLLFAQTQQLQIRKRHNAKGFINLESVDVGNADVGVLKGFGDSEGRGGCEFGGFLGGVAPAEDFGNGCEGVAFHERLRDEEESGGTVRERRGVWGSDSSGTVGDEGGFDGLQFIDIKGHEGFFVLVDYGCRFASGAGNGDQGDFMGEDAGLGGVLGFLDTADGVGVLVGAGEGVVRCAFFCL